MIQNVVFFQGSELKDVLEEILRWTKNETSPSKWMFDGIYGHCRVEVDGENPEWTIKLYYL